MRILLCFIVILGSYTQVLKAATPAPTPDSAAMRDFANSEYYQYSQRIHAMVEFVVTPDFMAHRERLKGGSVKYVFYLDTQGHIISLKTHSSAGSKWGEQTLERAIRGLKFGPVPPGVWKYLHHGPPLKIDGDIGWEPRRQV
jgi:outer membrane biosynthesis protein TonB